MYDLPANTMFSYLNNPMFDEVDFSQLPARMLAQQIDAFGGSKRNHSGYVYPETDALKFYFLNHVFHIMKSKFHPLEQLDPALAHVAEQHIQVTNQIAKRLFFYSTIIAVEEARFMHNQETSFYNFLSGSYGDEFGDYVQNGFKGSLTDFGKLDMTCGEYTTGMVSVFAFGKWQPGFGGKGWVPIASLVSDCVHGRLSFEQMADQAFSLCHNNGSMFNKGHMYHCYSDFIYKVLDIQDSGQIPQWIGNNLNSKFVDSDLAAIYKAVAKHFPDEMGGNVDQSLLKNSAAKREKKAAQLAKQQQAAWNKGWGNPAAAPKPAPDQKLNKILLGGIKVGP